MFKIENFCRKKRIKAKKIRKNQFEKIYNHQNHFLNTVIKFKPVINATTAKEPTETHFDVPNNI